MAAKKVINVNNLQALGAARLAELLVDLTADNAVAKRRLRLEILAEQPEALAKEVRKRLNTIARTKSDIKWHQTKAVAAELETQCQLIIQKISPADPKQGTDLLWLLMSLANPVLDRSYDQSGIIDKVFVTARDALGKIATGATLDPVSLADRTFDALTTNDYGQYDGLIGVMAPALGEAGLEHLQQRFRSLADAGSSAKPSKAHAVIVGFDGKGPIFRRQDNEDVSANLAKQALKDIADIRGDVDGYISLIDEKTRKNPAIATQIAHRLLAAGRAAEALAILDTTGPPPTRLGGAGALWWDDARIAALATLGRMDEAQATRWQCFERVRSADHLRAYLKQLPDFDDIIAERRALTAVEHNDGPLMALSFLIDWPALDRAARVVCEHYEDLDGNRYETLGPVAEALAAQHPLAATLALRAMINFTLVKTRASRYRHAARHLEECAHLAISITRFDRFASHDDYVAQLRRTHGRQKSFWAKVSLDSP